MKSLAIRRWYVAAVVSAIAAFGFKSVELRYAGAGAMLLARTHQDVADGIVSSVPQDVHNRVGQYARRSGVYSTLALCSLAIAVVTWVASQCRREPGPWWVITSLIVGAAFFQLVLF